MTLKRAWAAFSTAAIIAGVVLIIMLPLTTLVRIGEDYVLPVPFWSAIAFIAYYTLVAPWWHNPMGRMLVALDAGVALALLGDVLEVEFGVTVDTTWLLRLTVAALVIVAVTVLTRIWLLGRLHGWMPRLPWRHEILEPEKASDRS